MENQDGDSDESPKKAIPLERRIPMAWPPEEVGPERIHRKLERDEMIGLLKWSEMRVS